MHKQLVIKMGNGWSAIFRKQKNRPIEFLRKHETLGPISGWQVAKNFCLKAIISEEELSKHFNMTPWQFRYGAN